MYAAKAEGRDRVSLFNEDLRTMAAARMSVEADLRHALDRGQLAVWYQPEVDLTHGFRDRVRGPAPLAPPGR